MYNTESSVISSQNLSVLLDKQVVQLLLSVGSNHRAVDYLLFANQELSQLGSVIKGMQFVNPDYTASNKAPKPDYTNQSVLIQLSVRQSLAKFIKLIKAIEDDCQRKRKPLADAAVVYPANKDSAAQHNINDLARHAISKEHLVSLDIDILAIKSIGEGWQVIKERQPFKHHEVIGVKSLLTAISAVENANASIIDDQQQHTSHDKHICYHASDKEFLQRLLLYSE